MATRVAVVGGYALRPGVSRNNRLYTPEMISKAVQRAQVRIRTGDLNITSPDSVEPGVEQEHLISQRTHHEADDDSTRIVGRVTSMSLTDDGSARFTADIADTTAGRDIAALIAPRNPADPTSVEPFLKGVSIRGYWIGPVRRETNADGQSVETADDLEIDGLDYTASPGVHGAQIDQFTPSSASRPRRETAPDSQAVYSTASNPGRVLVRESVQEVRVQSAVEQGAQEKGAPALKSGKPAAAPTPGASSYADPGYQDDKAKRYPLDTKAHAKAAWSYINMPKNAKAYTPAQLKRIKGRIKAALAKFGVKIDSKEHWLIEPAHLVVESESALLAEYYPDSSLAGSFSVNLSNGPVTVSVSSYSVDPADLDLVGRAAMDGACKALATLDPDMDGDMDVPGADAEDTDHDMGGETDGETESVRGPDVDALTETDPPAPVNPVPVSPAPSGADVVSITPEPAPDPAADAIPQEEHGMSEPTPAVEPQAPTAPTIPAPAPAAPAEPAPPATPAPVTTPPPAAAGSITLSGDQFQQLLSAVRQPAMAAAGAESAPAPAAATTETAPPPAAAPVTETQEQMIARLVAAGVKEALPLAVQEHVQATGLPGRRGLIARRPTTETAPGADSTADGLNAYGVPADWPDKPLKDYTPAERKQYIQPALLSHYLGDRANS